METKLVDMFTQIALADAKYAAPGKYLRYGTAGFRDDASKLDRAFFRVGLVVALRAKLVGTMGIMITASHNPAKDNGVKIIEPNGHMLTPEWEPISEKIVNSESLQNDVKEQLFGSFSKEIKDYLKPLLLKSMIA